MKAKYHRQQAWKLMHDNWGVMALTTLVLFLILAACGVLSYYPRFPYFSAFALVAAVTAGPFLLGYNTLALNIMRYRDAKIERLFEGFRNFLRAFLLCLINGLLVLLWTLLLIVPGIIKSLSYSMSYFILADNPHMSSNDARKLSAQIMHGNKARLFRLHLSFLGWWILCILTLGILFLWIIPYHRAAVASFYHGLTVRPQTSYSYS